MSLRDWWEARGARGRRVLLVGATLVLLGAGWRFGLQPYVATLRRIRREVASQTHGLAADRAALASGAHLEGTLRAQADLLRRLRGRLLGTSDRGLAYATVAQLTQDDAQGSRVHLAHVTPRRSSPDSGALRKVEADISGVSDLQGILTLVSMLLSDSTALSVPRIEVSRPASNSSRRSDPGPLDVRMTVDGYMLAAPVAPPSPQPTLQPSQPAGARDPPADSAGAVP